MPVYMIQAGGDGGPVKIGYGDPEKRLAGCQVGNHLELRIIRVFEGGADEEAMLHELFADLWLRGEWHNFSRAMMGDVGLIEIELERDPEPEPEPELEPIVVRLRADRSMPVIENIKEIVRRAGGPLKLGKEIGLSHSAISCWKRVPALHCRRVSELTGIPMHELNPSVFPAPTGADAAA
jgi:hypothetical protein